MVNGQLALLTYPLYVVECQHYLKGDAMKYHAIPASIIVKPVDEPIFYEYATIISIQDEAAGPFVKVSQPGAEHEDNAITIEGTEWPLIRDSIQDMLNVTQGLEADTLNGGD